ncbi:uncharacterized protein LOC125673543 [Ostrea edulis]|uniref:uncharacterized protein LOC125673543 n=1 Tax=Ostrea edulis TaxID=37623 RepID=UPI0024AF27E5|nr:uncharacterized protein LOC125673543 [Ostrea edulis]
MSSTWSSWVESLMGDRTSMQRCGIYGNSKGDTWGVSDGMEATPEEVQYISSNYDENEKFHTEGCRCGGKKYNFVRKVEDVLVFKRSKMDQPEQTETSGTPKTDLPFLLAMNTTDGCLIGIANGDEKSKSQSIMQMEFVAKKLKESGR